MARANRFLYTKEDIKLIDAFVDSCPAFQKDQYRHSYRLWYKGGMGWNNFGQGGTGQMKILVWYQHVHKPGSNEWRPKIILRALLDYLQSKKNNERKPTHLAQPAHHNR